MKFEATELAVLDTERQEWFGIGVMFKTQKWVHWHSADGWLEQGSQAESMADAANANNDIQGFWEYWMDRGAGGSTSVSNAIAFEAKDLEEAVAVAFERFKATPARYGPQT